MFATCVVAGWDVARYLDPARPPAGRPGIRGEGAQRRGPAGAGGGRRGTARAGRHRARPRRPRARAGA
ncbi:MAG: hypothetical protein ACRDTH_08840, partial [Pseudonocardiaceae bacterium]